MEFVDTNISLRYLLEDNEEQFAEATQILETSEVLISFDVIAETVYVLMSVYKIPRGTIARMMIKRSAYPTVKSYDHEVLNFALTMLAKTNLDIVDCLLIGYNNLRGHEVHTFDKQMKKYLR